MKRFSQEIVRKLFEMKKPSSLLLTLCLSFCECQKELADLTTWEKNELAIFGTWRLLKMTDKWHQTFTNADPCFADDTFNFSKDSAVLSQGACIEFPNKEQNLKFSWKFLSEDVVDMGGDTVKIIVINDTSFVFKRNDPEYLEYHWYRNR